MSPFSIRWAAVGAALELASLAASCTPVAEQAAQQSPEACSRWEEGCPCDPGTAPVSCDEELAHDGSKVTCGSGARACVDGLWSGCTITEQHLGVARQALVGAGVSTCSPCKPYCATVASYPTAGGDIAGDNAFNIKIDPLGGISLATPPVGGGTVCVGGGPGCTGFDLSTGDGSGMMSTGLSLAANGNIVLTNPDSTGAGSGASLAGSVFVSNTGDGSLSRYDYLTFKETGRWWTCPAMSTTCDPSRTSVNTRGDAFVANRGHKSVIRISNMGTSCRDTTGPAGIPDGQIKTWNKDLNGGKPLPWVMVSGVSKPTDDCVVWYRSIDVGAKVRGIAAQDLTDPVTGELREYVWVGGNEAATNHVALLDGGNGNTLVSVPLPGGAGIYGMAMDRGQNLWMLNKSSATGALMRLDTKRCNTTACLPLTWCYSGVGIATDCDSAIAESITSPSDGYGITVDYKQRVWLSNRKLTRYDRSLPRGAAPYAGRFKTVEFGGGNGGVAADAKGWIWTCGGAMVYRVKGDDPTITHKVFDATGVAVDCTGKGIGVDTAGKIWTIPKTSQKCHTP